jgi:hypothetical protein
VRAEAVVVLGAASALFILGILGFIVTEVHTEDQVVPGGDPQNPDDHIQIETQISPFKGVGVTSIMFGAVIVAIFGVALLAARRSR